MGGYELEEERILSWLKSRRATRVLIQAPDGIKPYLRDLCEVLAAAGIEAIVSGSHAWGGCDVAVREAVLVGADAVVHIGHHGPVRFRPPGNLLFIEGRAGVSIHGVVEIAAEKLVEKGVENVALLTTIQHLHELRHAKSLLSEHGINVFLARSSKPYMREGLITGCDVEAAKALESKVEAFLVVSGGVFHALGVGLITRKTVFAADPYTNRVLDIERNVRRVIAVRLNHLADALDAREALIVASTKPGQFSATRIRRVKAFLSSRGINCKVAVFGDLDRGVLEDLGSFDVYVNAACPRLAVDDYHIFPGPVINPGELRYLDEGLENYDPASALQW